MKIRIETILLLTILVISNSCNVSKQQPKVTKPADQDYIKSDQVAFIEFIQTQEGFVMKGKAPEGRRIDGPTYSFDKETRQLNSYRKMDYSIDTVKAILGNGVILKGAAGTGLSLRLTTIGKFPFTMDNLTILGVSSKGLSIVFDKKEQLVTEGEQWESSHSTIDTLKYETPVIIKYTTTSSIRYHGLIDKKGITQ